MTLKNNTSVWLSTITTGVLGLLFIIWHNHINLLSWIVIVIGILILIPGIISLISSFRPKPVYQPNEEMPLPASSIPGRIAAICTIILGSWMIITPEFFIGLIAYLFAIALVIYGLYQIYFTAWVTRVYITPWYYYIMPVSMIVAGIIILSTSVHTMNSIVVLITGIIFLLSAISQAIQISKNHPKRKNRQISA